MKTLSLAAAAAVLLFCLGRPGANAQPSSADRISSMIKPGEVYQLETIAPLIDAPDRVTIRDFGPSSWVLVEYESSVLAPGELLPKARKGQMWVNFEQVVAARKIEAEQPSSQPPGSTPAPKK